MIQSSSDSADAAARARTERLLQGASDAAALRHRLALIDAEAQHRLAQHRSHYNPDQPRVPKGHPDGGQWTDTGSSKIGIRVAGDTPRLGRHPIIALLMELATLAIDAYRKQKGLEDLFGHNEGVVAHTTLDGKEIFGVNSGSRAYTSVDDAAAVKLRAALMKNYPELSVGDDYIGKMPRNAIFHAETTLLLRVARENGGTLAGKELIVYTDTRTCNNCEAILPYVGLELGRVLINREARIRRQRRKSEHPSTRA